ncbi:hypothetical protein CTAYLR_009124 [Chrysophaeum taylorii]|uniref:Cytochrome b5 heme-binding domain-containing protein n=1 Tax=Chrysophaeum taylorii TaxID=2483200 RepID=A0AAD7XPQ8_9STRA|nr:hypothetical protein CTAYLR_009124 [Chrysophaeum taylorii]
MRWLALLVVGAAGLRPVVLHSRRCYARRMSAMVEAESVVKKSSDIIVVIGDKRVNVTEYAREHPGGAEVLRRFHGKNATKAFEAARHSKHAHDLVQRLSLSSSSSSSSSSFGALADRGASVAEKLFTPEDKSQTHKVLGLFCLGHYAWRYALALASGDVTAGFGAIGAFGIAALLAHAALSLSSFKFHVPRERMAKRPMIWSEFRVHNTCFALRSFLCCVLAAVAVDGPPALHRLCVVGCSAVALASLYGADVATAHLRQNSTESTTATMPYWHGASDRTQQSFKKFYAYCQFCATLGCLAPANPCWPFVIALPIQLASFLMTLVRKSILTTRGYHYIYTASLVLPFFVGLRDAIAMARPDFFLLLPIAALLLLLRRRGVNKYALWLPVIAGRIAIAVFSVHPNVPDSLLLPPASS